MNDFSTDPQLASQIAEVLDGRRSAGLFGWLPASLSRRLAVWSMRFGRHQFAFRVINSTNGASVVDLLLKSRILGLLCRFDEELAVLEKCRQAAPDNEKVKAQIRHAERNLFEEGTESLFELELADADNFESKYNSELDERDSAHKPKYSEPTRSKRSLKTELSLENREVEVSHINATNRSISLRRHTPPPQSGFSKSAGGLLGDLVDLRSAIGLPIFGQRARYEVGRSLEQQREFGAGLRFLLRQPAWLRGPAEEVQLARLYLRLDQPDAAAIHGLRAIEMSPSLHNMTVLAECALKQGGHGAVKRIESVIRERFVRSRGRNSLLARMALMRLDFATAYREANELGLGWDNVHNFQVLQECLWQMGKGEQAWRLGMALAFGLPELASSSDSVFQRTAGRLLDDINSRKIAISKSTDAEEFSKRSYQLGDLMRNPLQLKENTSFNPGANQVLAKLWALEEAEQDEAFVDAFSRSESDILGSTPVGARLGGLHWRVAQARLRIGQAFEALADIQRACFYMRADPGLKLAYREILAARAPNLTDGAVARTAVLILSCKKNLARSTQMAQNVSAVLNRAVLVLIGDASAKEICAETHLWGHTLTVPVKDDYNGLTEKLLWAYRYLFACSPCTGVLKIDDDIAVTDPDKFRQMVDQLDKETRDYMGQFRSFSNPVFHHSPHKRDTTGLRFALHRPVQFCDGACGYYLSRRALEKIFERSLSFFEVPESHVTYEDAYFGEMLAADGIKPHNCNLSDIGGYQIDCFEPEKAAQALADSLAASSVSASQSGSS